MGLDSLVGEWLVQAFVEGRIVNESTATVEWSTDGNLLMRGENGSTPADAPREWHENLPFPTTMTIGSDDASDELTILYADGRKVHRVIRMTLADGVWRMWRDAPGFNQRFEGRVAGDRIEGVWEMSKDGVEWNVDFDVVYTRR